MCIRDSVWGALFVDGSCARHAVRELTRAASSVCMVDSDGTLVAEFRALVWSPYPQSPRALSSVLSRGLALWLRALLIAMFIPIALMLFGLQDVRSLSNCQAKRCTLAPSCSAM
eukprot:1045532-Pyramimonas_sp.AAC.1